MEYIGTLVSYIDISVQYIVGVYSYNVCWFNNYKDALF